MKTKVHNLIIVDASGSMGSIYQQALTGMNETIKTIRSVQENDSSVEQYLTLLSFSNGGERLQYVYDNVAIDTAKDITEKDYELRGCTALYDAIGISVTELRKSVSKEDKALVTIITDGYENDSRKWNSWEVKQLIDELRTQGWVFTYIGANQDVEAEAHKMGVVNSYKFEATIEGTVEMFAKEASSRKRWNERVSRGEQNLEEGYFNEDPMPVPSNRITPERVDQLGKNEVFVFGSNILGKHDGGAALAAMKRFGAQYGKGEGPQGNSYAIPTVGCTYQETALAVKRFIRFAKIFPNVTFYVTAIGCGNGGWRVEDMANLFMEAKDVDNICLPEKFWRYINSQRNNFIQY